MTVGMAVQSALEILVAVALFVGFCFEDKVAAWERRTARRLLRKLGKSNVVELQRKRSPRDQSKAI